MSLLTPWFLAGLAAIGVPIIVHLINRERKTVVNFPSLMFLQRIPYRSVRRQKLRHLLLFSLRCLALFLLVAAFARPFFSNSNRKGPAPGTARERVILLDRSYSMGYGDHWKKATDAAVAAVKELGAQEHGSVIAFASDAAVLTDATAGSAELERAIGRVTLSAEGTRFGPAVKLAGEILAASNLPHKEVLLISDFQKRGWTTQTEVHLPPDVTMTAVDVSEKDAPDLAVASVATDRDRAGEAEGATAQVTVVARVVNTGKMTREVTATLELGGRVIETKRATIPASGAGSVRFAATAVPSGVTRGVVRIPHDALPANDAFNFTLAPDEAVSVLVIEPPQPRANQSLYLRRSLEIGDRPRFHVDTKWADSVRPQDFARRSMVVLNEVPPPGGEIGARLREAVRAGTGLLVIPSAVPTERIAAEWQPVLRLRLGLVVDKTPAGGARIARMVYSNPVFEAFSAPGSGDFAGAHVFHYRQLAVPGDSGVIAWYDDGAPALVERTFGRGKVLIWASSFDDYWTDFPMQPVFLPFIHELAKHAGRYSDSRPWFTAGEVLDLARHGELTAGIGAARPATAGGGAPEPEVVIESPAGKRTRFTAADTSRAIALTEQGFYELRGPATAPGNGRPVAVNVDLAESDLAHIEPNEVIASITAPTPGGVSGASAGPSTPQDLERRQTLWWYLLMAAFLVMAAETMLSNRLSGAGDATGTGGVK